MITKLDIPNPLKLQDGEVDDGMMDEEEEEKEEEGKSSPFEENPDDLKELEEELEWIKKRN